jgi:hypothetical protein
MDVRIDAEANAALVIREVVFVGGLVGLHLVAELLVDLVSWFQFLVVEAALGVQDIRGRSGTGFL